MIPQTSVPGTQPHPTSIGIFAGTRYVPAALVSTNGNLRLYQIAIPKERAVRLLLDTSLRVASATGAELAAGQPSTSIAAGGATAIALSLTIL